jgi:prepilin-type N-terminal cleavage/methylation domain-containing protein
MMVKFVRGPWSVVRGQPLIAPHVGRDRMTGVRAAAGSGPAFGGSGLTSQAQAGTSAAVTHAKRTTNNGRRTTDRRRGFTLVELLVVVLIVLIISAAALPVVIPAYSHRQVNEAARILQGALVGAHDIAIHNGSPAGIRLLPDPAFSGIDPNYNALNMALPLACNRIIPINPAPDYQEGNVSIIQDLTGFSPFANPQTFYPYPPAFYTTANNQTIFNSVLMVEECPGSWQQQPPGSNNYVFVPNEPTSWFWNIRIGERIQIGTSGQSYTVVGPLTINNQTGPNPDLFVNDGAPGSIPQLRRTYVSPAGNQVTVQVEYLFLVNGVDDPQPDGSLDGFVDNFWGTPTFPNPWPGNNGDALTNLTTEFENETWQGALGSLLQPVNALIGNLPPVPQNAATLGLLNQNYTITRRPVPSAQGREIQLPSNVVIDLTTSFNTLTLSPPLLERSRIPLQAINQYTGSVDILVYPTGQVVPTMNYSSPASVSLSGSFFHFWLAERGDVAAPTSLTVSPALPIGTIQQQLLQGQTYSGPKLKGEYRLVTVFSRNGQVTTNGDVFFDNPLAPQNGTAYNPNLPFLQAQQGITGGQ